MGVSWGTQWGYVVSRNPRKCAVFCEDKRPTAHYARDSNGNEVVGIRDLPAPTTSTQFILAKDEQDAQHQAKLAQYQALISTLEVYSMLATRLKLQVEMKAYQLRKRKGLTFEEELAIARDQGDDKDQLQKCLDIISSLTKLKQRKAPEYDLEDLMAMPDDEFLTSTDDLTEVPLV